MHGRYYDGRRAVPLVVEVRPDGDGILILEAGWQARWLLREIVVERVGAQVRLAPRAHATERLMLDAQAWTVLAPAGSPSDLGRRRTEHRLIAALALSAGLIGAFIFLGIPALAGPLARRTPPELERQIGDNFESQVRIAFPTCRDEPAQAALARFGDRLQGEDSAVDVRVRAVQAPMVNAFALPGGTVMVTDDLIELARGPDELSAVIAHEVAHVRERHVMQAVWRSLGLGLLLDAVVGGGTGAGQQAVLLIGSVTDLRYSRSAEAEADAKGQALLAARGLSSQGMAPFFERLAAKGESADAAAVKELLSDHPDALRRARASRARARSGATAFTPAEWAAIKDVCKTTPDRFRKLKKLF